MGNFSGFNRYIVECKCVIAVIFITVYSDLIDT